MPLRSSVDFNTTNLYLYVWGDPIWVVINSDTVSKQEQISERNCEDMVLDGHLYSTQVPIATMAASIWSLNLLYVCFKLLFFSTRRLIRGLTSCWPVEALYKDLVELYIVPKKYEFKIKIGPKNLARTKNLEETRPWLPIWTSSIIAIFWLRIHNYQKLILASLW